MTSSGGCGGWRRVSTGLWALRQLRTVGFSPAAVEHLLADGRLFRLHRGTYAVGRPRVSRHGDWMAAVVAIGAGAVLSHHAAAALWDLRRCPPGPIDVTIDRRARRPRRGITVHASALHPEDREVIDAIPVTSLARTLLDLGETATPTQHRRAYERAERLELLDTRSMDRLLGRSNGRRGVGTLRALLDYDPTTAARAVSELEALFLDLVRADALPLPEVNVLVEGFLVDAFWPDARLVVELDGYEHHRDREAFERDRFKQAKLRVAGYDVVAFTYRQVVERPAWVADVVRGLLGRAAMEANL